MQRSEPNPEPEVPMFSIITAVLNAKHTIHSCIDSLANQTFQGFEHILIDGGSTDGTCELLNRERHRFSALIIEPDEGVYDAWNKGLKHVRGQWVLFLGADDALYDSKVLEDVDYFISHSMSHSEPKQSTKLIYGNLENTSKDGNKKLWTVDRPLKAIGKRFSAALPLMPPTPACFYHSELFSTYGGFDESYRISGDKKFTIRIVLNETILKCHRTITRMRLDGLSSSLQSVSFKENCRIINDLQLTVPKHRILLAGMVAYQKVIAKKLFGRKMSEGLVNAFRAIKINHIRRLRT